MTTDSFRACRYLRGTEGPLGHNPGVSVSRELDDAGVSAREGEVLAALGEHLTNAEIADRLYISVRTVESHVSSLLRKLGVGDRRSLARLASGGADTAAPPPSEPGGTSWGATASVVTSSVGPSVRPGARSAAASGPDRAATSSRLLPSPLTPFVGRVAERTALADAIDANRLVTAVGPGGVGKTRLALAVAGDLADRFAGGVWYVDLVPVTDPAMITSAVASTVGLGEQLGRSVEDTLVAWLASRHALLVLDNCEHLVDGVAVLVERLLSRCPLLSVLATSRTRLVLPFEAPFPVPGLSLGPGPASEGPGAQAGGPPADGASGPHPPADGRGEPDGDAVALFLARAAAAGSPVTAADDRRRVAAVCAALDGMALAIELAASRLPALGLDGLEAGLADRLRVLTGGSRADERHRSLRATLDWSYALGEPADQAVLRRASVFAAPFTTVAAAEVVALDRADATDGADAEDGGPDRGGPNGGAPGPVLDPAGVADALARLVDQSLLVVERGGGETRYRALETIRQYGDERLGDAERTAVHARHLAWSLLTARALADGPLVDGAFRSAFDDVADDLRSALAWATASGRRDEGHRLASCLAGLAYRRSRGAESQHRYEEAAGLAADPSRAARSLHHAAEVAASRQDGDAALRLHRAAVDAALRAGDDARASRSLARAASLIYRAPGLFADFPGRDLGIELLRRARTLALDDPAALTEVLVAEAFSSDQNDVLAESLAERCVELAQRRGDPLVESTALDWVTVAHLARGEVVEAAGDARRRVELLAPLPPMPESAFEVFDAYEMATETALGAGDLSAAGRFARSTAELHAYRDEPHLAYSRLMLVGAVAGRWDEVVSIAERFEDGWAAAGRPVVGNLSRGATAAAFVHAMRGDDAGRDHWLGMVAELKQTVRCIGPEREAFEPLLAATVALHRGEFDAALHDLHQGPEELRAWFTGMWRQWYGAAWAEAAVLAGRPDVADRLARARFAAFGNPVAMALVDRAAALATGDRAGLLAAADALDAAGCGYQWARTLVLAGGPEAAAGEQALAAMGATPTVLPDR